jgi:hypothetical protein
MKNTVKAIASNNQIEEVEKGFVKVPVSLLFDPNISDQAIRLYLIMRSYGRNGDCYPSQERLANDTGKTPRTVQRIQNELYEEGLINNLGRIVDERSGHLRHSNTYALADHHIRVVPPKKAALDKNVVSDTTKMSYKVDLNKENLNTVCETPPTRDMKVFSDQASDPNQPEPVPELEPYPNTEAYTEPELATFPAASEVQAGKQAGSKASFRHRRDLSPAELEIIALYEAEGVATREAELVALNNPALAYATELIQRSKQGWIKDTPATIVYHGLRGTLPTKRRKQSRSSRRTSNKPIDFTKYQSFDPIADLPQTETDSADPAPEASSNPQSKQLATIKYLLRQASRDAGQDLKTVRIENAVLQLGFYNKSSYNNVDLASWLPYFAILDIRRIELVQL